MPRLFRLFFYRFRPGAARPRSDFFSAGSLAADLACLPTCDKALPAADLALLLARSSLRTFDAAVAAFGEVDLLGEFLCDRALPAADFEAVLAVLLLRVFPALLAARLRVTFTFSISVSSDPIYHILLS